MRPDSLLEWVKPPQQERSQRTLARLLDAAEAIVLEQGVEGLNIAAVAKRAESSVGAFYARFGDKDGLLGAVCERFLTQARATIDAVLEVTRWHGDTLELVLSTGLRFMLRTLVERRLLLTGLIGLASRDPHFTRMLDELTSHFTTRLHDFLEARHELPGAGSTPHRVAVLSAAVLSTAQAHAARHPAQPALLTDSVLADELTAICLAVLTQGTPRATGGG